MPFQEVDFSGRVLPDGVVTIRFSHTNRTYRFDRIDDASLRSPKGNGGLRALTPADADRFAAYDAEIAAITAGRPPRFKSTVVPPGERARRLQRKDYFHAPADGYKTLGTRDDARMLTDGAHGSYWYGAKDGWVGLRYPEPVRAAGLLIATSTGGTDAVPVVTLTVNGVASEPLPHAGNGLIEVRFGRTMEVVDVELELFGSRVYIQEVYLLKPR